MVLKASLTHGAAERKRGPLLRPRSRFLDDIRSPYYLALTRDRQMVVSDGVTQKILKYDLDKTMNAYAGAYKLDGNKLTYRFEVTHDELGADRASVREIKIEGRRLTMVNQPARGIADTRMGVTTTVWEKVQAPAAAKK